MRVQAATTLPIPLELLRKWAYDDVDVEHALEVNDENFEPRPEPRYPYDGRREDLVPIIDLRTVLDTADTLRHSQLAPCSFQYTTGFHN